MITGVWLSQSLGGSRAIYFFHGLLVLLKRWREIVLNP